MVGTKSPIRISFVIAIIIVVIIISSFVVIGGICIVGIVVFSPASRYR
jgi:hypothetical protein